MWDNNDVMWLDDLVSVCWNFEKVRTEHGKENMFISLAFVKVEICGPIEPFLLFPIKSGVILVFLYLKIKHFTQKETKTLAYILVFAVCDTWIKKSV